MAARMHLGLVDDPPAPWPSNTSAEGAAQERPELRRGADVQRARLGLRLEHAEDDLARNPFGERKDVFVSGVRTCRSHGRFPA